MKKNYLLSVFFILLFDVQSYAQCCQYSYQQQVEPVTSAATFGVALADFDNDGDQDVVSISAYYGVDVYFNNGAGTFTLNAQYATGSNPNYYGVNVADIDNDGDKDILAMPFYSSASLAILKNNGAGVFTVTYASTYIGCKNAAIGDIDADNDIDIFIPNGGGGSGNVFKNNGLGVFTSFQTVSGARGDDARLGDLDGDGDLDAMVVENSTYGYSVFLNNGSGTFTMLGTNFGTNGSAMDLGDLDNDGDLDAWIGTSGNIAELWLNNGSASFALDTSYVTGYYAKAVNLYDYNSDGQLDAFLGFYSAAPQVWTKTELADFSLCYQAPVGSSSHGMAIGDVNGDSIIDIYSGYFSNDDGDYVFLNTSPSIDYVNNVFCPYESTPQTVTVSNSTGGYFTAVPSGLSIDSASGQIIPLSSAPGTYQVSYTATNCVVKEIVTVNDLDLTIDVDGATLTANQDSASYQWVDCMNPFATLPADTHQVFVAGNSGDFAVKVTYKGCSDTSACVNVNMSAIASIQAHEFISIFPNPSNGMLYLECHVANLNNAFAIYDVMGRLIIQGILKETKTSLDVSNLQAGIYYFRIDHSPSETIRLVINPLE